MADLAETVRSIPLFSGLSREDVAKIMGNLQEVEFAAGATIFSQGNPGDALYLIQSGAVQVVLNVSEDRSEIIAVMGPQEYFGEMALLSSAPRSATVIAVKDSTLWKLSRESWDELIAKHPSWLLHFCAILSQRLSVMDREYSRGRDAFNSLAEEFYIVNGRRRSRFYRQASLLTTLDSKVLSFLLPTEKAAAFIADLENSELPLMKRVDGGYELHGFFREFLTEKLLGIEGAEKKQQLHVEFAALYEAENNWERAIHQRLEAKDWPGASRIIVHHKDELIQSSALFLRKAIARIPQDYFYGELPLIYIHADVLCCLGDSLGAARCYKQALSRREPPVGAESLAKYQEVADGLIEKKDYPQALRYLRSALDLIAQQASAIASDPEAGDVQRPHRTVDREFRGGVTSWAWGWMSWFSGFYQSTPRLRLFGGILGLTVWAYLWFATPDIGLTAAATKQLAVLLLTLIYWVFWVFPDYGVALIFALGFILTGLGKPEVVLGGFASTTWFMTLGVLGLGAAITTTGLFYRFSLQFGALLSAQI
jgi:CRP-like cAMP-binding protein